MELLEYKICQKARRNRQKEQSNFIYSSTCKNSKINRLVIRRICFCPDKFWAKACKIQMQTILMKLEKDAGQKTQKQQILNISDLESTFNASDKNCQIYFRRKAINTIISKIKTQQHDETHHLTSFIANPAAQMLKNISKLVCVSLLHPPPRILSSFSAILASKFLFCFVFVPSFA